MRVMSFKTAYEHYLMEKDGQKKYVPIEMKERYKAEGWKIIRKENLKSRREK